MGLFKADQIRNAAGTGNTDLYKQWATKALAHANVNGTGNMSKNVASYTDPGVGLETMNLTSAMATTSYSVSAGTTDANTVDQLRAGICTGSTANTVSMKCINHTPAKVDPDYWLMAINGDLA